VTALLGAVLLLFLSREHYPVQRWLSPRYGRALLLSAVFALASLSMGRFLFGCLRLKRVRLGEKYFFSFALGVLAFYLGLFLGGLVGAQGRVFFLLLPLGLFAAGFRLLRRDYRALVGHRVLPPRVGALLPRNSFELASALLLLAGTAMLYLQILAPENTGYDAGWYHLPLAEDFARDGVHRFRDGWYLSAYPQLASTLYSWAFQQPFVGTFDKVMLAAHLEWVLFVATLFGVGLLARRIAFSGRMRFASAALFLFPGIFVYDSNLIMGADHVLAFWAVPIALATMAAARDPSVSRYALAAAFLSGAVLTKYQALFLVIPAGFVLLVVAFRARAFRALAVLSLACVVLTAPHWLKNVVFYGDPAYPLFHALLDVTPFHEGAAKLVTEQYRMPDFAPQGSLGKRLWDTLKGTTLFWVDPRDIWDFHHNVPAFGPVFPLLLVPLAFARKTRRIWALIAAIWIGMLIWWWTNHQERFLQVLLPWFAAATGAALLRIGLLGRAARIGSGALVGVALVYGGDLWFYPREDGWSGIALTGRHLSAGLDGKSPERLKRWSSQARAKSELPKDAVVLLHGERMVVGLERRFVSDDPGYQGATDYGALRSPARVQKHLRALGVTHALISRDPGVGLNPTTLAKEVVFHSFIEEGAKSVWKAGGHELFRLGDSRLRGSLGNVAVLGCREEFEPGYFRIEELLGRKEPNAPLDLERLLADPAAERVEAIFIQTECKDYSDAGNTLEKHFHVVGRWSNGELLLPGPAPKPSKPATRSKRSKRK
jgi:hypothetical protein